MIVNKKTTYDKGYKPRIVYGRVEVKYYPENLRALAKTNPKKVMKRVKSFQSRLTTIVVDENNLIPTMNLHKRYIKNLWEHTDALYDSSFAWISKIDIVKDLGRVNYNFNQNIH